MLTVLLILAGCTSEEMDSAAVVAPGGLPSGTTTTTTTTTSCDLGLACNPIPIGAYPFVDERSTADAPGANITGYSCAPDTDESGPEWFYAATVEQRGILSVSVDDVGGDDVDIDVHLLSGTEPSSCLNRDNVETSWVVEPGTWFVVADTWVSSSGEAMSGDYTLTVDFLPLDGGPCATVPTDLRMFWSECGPNTDCTMTDVPVLHTPSAGEVVKEAHLVTTDEDFGGGWPSSFTDQIERHYQVTEAASGYAMAHTEPWAPAGEGGSEFGQGSTGAPIPPEHETWYVNMYWRDRPAQGHRMILVNPFTGAAVVAAAGYETGPGSNEAIGGASEEIHDVLGTVHRSEIVMAFAADQDLDYGPIDCGF